MNALTHDQLRQYAPSIFASSPWEKMSSRYRMVPTIEVVGMLADQGFLPVRAQQSSTRIEGKGAFTRHMIRFRQPGVVATRLGDEIPELVLVNSHDGTSGYQFNAGVFRLVCLNGMVVQSADHGSISVRHTGQADFQSKIIDATFKILETSTDVMKNVEAWKQVSLSRPQQEAFAAAAIEIRDGIEIQPRQLLAPKRRDDQPNPDGSRDLWKTMNTVQEHLLRGGDRGTGSTGRRATTRPIKSVDADVKTNKALWRLTEEMAKLVGA